MRSEWRTETGHLACRWTEMGQLVQYNPRWMQEASESGYVPAVVDFASHSPFGGASWFRTRIVGRDSE
jgi:hypothetical protein